jgi:DNA-binding response OmpR family regulator
MNASIKRIFIVDDEKKIVEVIKSYFENSGYIVYAAYKGKDFLDLFDKIKPSLVILDLMLPDISGEEICEILRKRSRVPIIMLTAKTDEENILNGFELGADDYVKKPLSPRQLVARANALLQRIEPEEVLLSSLNSFNDGDLIINNTNYEVKKCDNTINLTPNEYNIIVTMSKHPLKIFTRTELISIVLGENFNGYDRAIDSHVKNLRRKIENDPKNPVYILTVHGIGYKFGGIKYEKD